jgi:CBS domain-containing protein
MKISDILRHKGAEVVTIEAHATVRDLLALLAEHNVGALVVVAGVAATRGGPVRIVAGGIVSERDIVRALHELGDDALDSTVADIMTPDLISCGPSNAVAEVAATMTEQRVRHMPVVEDGELVGIVTIGDVVLSQLHDLEKDRVLLEQYITG